MHKYLLDAIAVCLSIAAAIGVGLEAVLDALSDGVTAVVRAVWRATACCRRKREPSACPDVDLFYRTTPKFTSDGDGAGRSSYLMRSEAAGCFGFLEKRVSSPVCRVTIGSYSVNQFAVHKAVLDREGVVLIRGALKAETVALWKTRTRDAVRDLERFTAWTAAGPRVCHFDDYEGHAILHAPGRMDVWPWGHLPLLASDTADVYAPYPVREIVTDAARCDIVQKSVGLLAVDDTCSTYGRWHRDTSPLFKWNPTSPDKEDAGNVVIVPDYYFTCFIPLDPLDGENGAPEFILGSHRVAGSPDALLGLPVATVKCAPGDVIVMNGKTLHRGTPNRTEKARDMLYAVWAPPWFNEDTA